jgi:hypothetical protein
MRRNLTLIGLSEVYAAAKMGEDVQRIVAGLSGIEQTISITLSPRDFLLYHTMASPSEIKVGYSVKQIRYCRM